MTRRKQKLMIVLLVLLIVGMVLTVARFWWRIWPGYYFCDDEPSCVIVEVTDDHVILQKNIFNLGFFFDGYKYHIKDGTLYVGYKTMFLIGSYFSFNANMEIPTEEKVEKIVLCGRGKERVIYSEEE